MNREDPLVEILFDRLAADAVADDVAETVLAALSDDLDNALAGKPTTRELRRATDDPPRSHVYLSSVTVAGFRGVGPKQTLTLRDGRGLTLIVGRNGSGKSSFAEAVELALTGDSARWADKNSVWRTGWRNLHSPDPCRIVVDLRVDGAAEPLHVRRAWPAGAALADAEVSVRQGEHSFDSLADLGLTRPMELYRPFLTAAELGKLLSGTPSELFDAMSAILGMDSLHEADKRLMAAARPVEAAIKELRAERASLATTLAGVDDDRARRAAKALGTAHPDLDQLDAILAEPLDSAGDGHVDVYQRLAALSPPDPAEAARLAHDLAAAHEEARRHDVSASRASLRAAELLRLALDHHTDSGDGPCPVCRTGTLDATWRTTASAALDDLRQRTVATRRATSRVTDLAWQAQALVDAVTLPATDVHGIPLAEARSAVAALRDAPTAPDALAAHLARRYQEAAEAVETLRTAATEWLRQRDSGWQGVIGDVRDWARAARALPAREQRLTTLKAARKWLKVAGEDIRDRRIAPFAGDSQRIWQRLRQESNVQLGTMTLAGSSTRRRVEFPVSVDGTGNDTGLGVLSQGEMHALGLATFLPRSTAAESPFRFIVVDDPVQSMDPSKVDGLAQVFADLAETHQVVVFTHDTRLPDAVRRLEVDAQVIEVVRAEQSVVSLHESLDSVSRYLDDARAVALSSGVPNDVRAPVVAELCRSALEAACHRVIWRVRLARGEKHVDIEATIEEAASSLPTTLALALFDDGRRGGDVLGQLNRQHGPRAADAYMAARKGVHGGYLADLPRLVADIRTLAEALR